MQAREQEKVLASDVALKVTKERLQIHDAAGYGRDRPFERMAGDARMFRINGGTGQVLCTHVGRQRAARPQVAADGRWVHRNTRGRGAARVAAVDKRVT